MAIRVVIVGSAGRQGSSTITALLGSQNPKFEVTAFIRPNSVNKTPTAELAKRGVKIMAVDLRSEPHDTLVSALSGIDAILCFLPPLPEAQVGQIALADAAKEAGVKRFVLNAWGTVMPPKGIHLLREVKQEILDHIQKIYLPWTWIDIGLWHDIFISRVPSGRLDHIAFSSKFYIVGDGAVPCAVTSLDDVGRYVARIIADPRTINRFVFAYSDLLTGRQLAETIERMSGEQVAVARVEPESLVRAVESKERDPTPFLTSTLLYWHSALVRGDNQPERASFLGYLDARELYPELEPVRFEETIRRALQNKATEHSEAGRPESFWEALERTLVRFKAAST